MFQIFSNSGEKAYGIKTFIVDTVEDIATIPVDDLEMGCQCFSIDSSKTYMLNSSKQWIAITSSSSNSGESSTPQTIVYEGGTLNG